DYDGRVLEENYPEVRDVVSARTARIMVSMLQEVVLHGTGAAAAKLNHPLGQDRHHQRFHGRMVCRLLAVDYVRRLGWVRREEDAGQQGDRRDGRAADLDGLYARGAAGPRIGRVRCSAASRQCGRPEG